MADAGAGASTWAGGSHVWNGTIGVFTPRPTVKPRKTRAAPSPPPRSGCWSMRAAMSKVRGSDARYSPRMASSMASDPARVYRKNLRAERGASPWPQTAMRKYMPTRLTSKKT
jgi:hypothetical protein